tara:strand:- start:369 stop:584 length:216 start_codon:yes stop_codon:yes gene_type:complete
MKHKIKKTKNNIIEIIIFNSSVYKFIKEFDKKSAKIIDKVQTQKFKNSFMKPLLAPISEVITSNTKTTKSI